MTCCAPIEVPTVETTSEAPEAEASEPVTAQGQGQGQAPGQGQSQDHDQGQGRPEQRPCWETHSETSNPGPERSWTAREVCKLREDMPGFFFNHARSILLGIHALSYACDLAKLDHEVADFTRQHWNGPMQYDYDRQINVILYRRLGGCQPGVGARAYVPGDYAEAAWAVLCDGCEGWQKVHRTARDKKKWMEELGL